MKKLLFILTAFILFFVSERAAALDNFFYRWYAVDNSGQYISNVNNLQVRVSIKEDNTIRYQEIHSNVTTDQFAIFILEIGAGTPTQGYDVNDLRTVMFLANVRLQAEVSGDNGNTWSLVIVGELTSLPAPPILDLNENHIYLGGSDGQANERAVGGDLTVTNNGAIADFQIVENAVTGAELADETVTNAKIANATEFASIENAGGTQQFILRNANKSLRFEDRLSSDATNGDSEVYIHNVNFSVVKIKD